MSFDYQIVQLQEKLDDANREIQLLEGKINKVRIMVKDFYDPHIFINFYDAVREIEDILN